eukprot:Sspe_Gene.97577::Locus_71135_Transcript_1_1_Confidence_1.000_Length_1119::g.97577::m.97577
MAVFLAFQHGSRGSPEDLTPLAEAVKARCAEGGLPCHLWMSGLCAGPKTHAGLEKVRETLREDFRDALVAAITASPSGLKVVAVGHSFGGIIIRALLHDVRDLVSSHSVELVGLVTIASPHLGVGTMWRPMQAAAWAIGRTFSQAYLDLLLDSDAVLDLTTDDHVDFLASFQHRLLLGCVSGDPLVGFNTACLYDGCPEVFRRQHPEEHPYVQQAAKLHPVGDEEMDELRERALRLFSSVSADRGKRAADMMCRLRRLSWDIHPVAFPNSMWIMPHVAIVAAPRKFGAGEGTPVVEYTAKAIAGMLLGHYQPPSEAAPPAKSTST